MLYPFLIDKSSNSAKADDISKLKTLQELIALKEVLDFVQTWNSVDCERRSQYYLI
jgi:hypothetical protein